MQQIVNNTYYNHRSFHRKSRGVVNLTFMLVFISSFVVLTGSVANAYGITKVTRMSQFTGIELEPSNQKNMPTFPAIYNARSCAVHAVAGTDLGSSYSVTVNEKKFVRFLFGDTFGTASACPNPDETSCMRDARRSAIIGYTEDTDASDDIKNLMFIHGVGTSQAKQILPEPDRDNDAWYPIAGWAAGGYEWIWGLKYDLNLCKTNGRQLFYTRDQWQHTLQANAYMLPIFYKNMHFSTYFDFVSVTKKVDASGKEWIYFFGLPQARLGHIKVMRIKSSDMRNWMKGTKFPDIWTGTRKGWQPINTYAGRIRRGMIGAAKVGDGSVMWVPDIKRWLALHMSANHMQIDARFSKTEDVERGWNPAIRVFNSNWPGTCRKDSNSVTNVRYRNAYAPFLLSDYYSDRTVYFLFSRMSPDNGVMSKCKKDSYVCSARSPVRDRAKPEGSTRHPTCNLVYNTFLMKMTITD